MYEFWPTRVVDTVGAGLLGRSFLAFRATTPPTMCERIVPVLRSRTMPIVVNPPSSCGHPRARVRSVKRDSFVRLDCEGLRTTQPRVTGPKIVYFDCNAVCIQALPGSSQEKPPSHIQTLEITRELYRVRSAFRFPMLGPMARKLRGRLSAPPPKIAWELEP